LGHRNFRLFFFGQVVSVTGTWMESVAQSWLVYRLTGSSVLLGTITFASQIPVLLFSPLGGHAADRFSRRNIVVITQAASMVIALVLAWLTLGGHVRIWELIALAAVLGVVNAFDVPARQSFLVEMVGREDMINAIALNSTMFNLARMAGPAVAGILVARIGEGWCFFANGISYIAVIWGLLRMRLEPFTPPKRVGSAMANIREGFRYASRTLPIRALLLQLGCMSLFGYPVTVLMPVFAGQIFGKGSQAYGVLVGSIGLGACSGALLLASRTNVQGLSRWLAAAGTGFAVSLALFSVCRVFPVSCGLLFVGGFCMMVQVGSSNTLIQSMAPEEYRGRVMSLYSMTLIGMSPIGAMAAGFEAERLGAPVTLAIGAGACLVSMGVFVAGMGRFRAEARALLAAQGR
jgi:MFS family permease